MTENDGSINDKLDAALRLVTRRRWYILSIAVGTILTVVTALYQIPNRYTSEAILFVVEQQVPQRYVTPTSTTELADALPAMTQQVLSRSRLLQLVEEFDLYAPKRKGMLPEEIDAMVRQDIKIDALAPTPGRRGSNAFKISFTTSKAILAQTVTSKLTSLFIQENLKTREDQARNTTTLLHDRLENARQNLDKQEQLLRDFKSKYLGELPEQQQGNLAILGGAQSQLQNITTAIDRAQQQRVYLESLLNGYRRLAARSNVVSPGVVRVEGGRLEPDHNLFVYQAAQQKLTQLQSDKVHLLSQVRPQHPDVLALDREIAAQQAVVDGLKPKMIPEKKDSVQTKLPETTPKRPPESEEDASIAQLNSQLESNRLEIANLVKDQAQQQTIIAEYKGRLNLTPVREQQLAGILRDYELSKHEYADLLSKEQQSQLAMSLEQQQAGQQFRIVEPPSLPALPSTPQRLKISLGAVGAGLMLGLVVAGFAELKARVFYTEQDVTRHFSIPLVVGLPRLITPEQTRRRIWTKSLEWVGGSALITLILVAEFWVYRHP
jgi:polysaccharide chain length determinant protein (PEP-CTERM system associated)